MELSRLGEDSLQKFVHSLYKLLITNNRKFDMVVGAGNSGQIMVWITRVVYTFLKLPFPQNIVFPLYRYKDFPKKILFDNSTIVQNYSSIKISQDVKNILFVDDEIERGNSIEATIKILRVLHKGQENFNFTVIAEDGREGFEFNKNIHIEYIFSKKKIEGVYGALSYLIPEIYKDPIQKILEKKIKSVNNKKIMCILLQLPIKEPNNGKPQFTFRFQEVVKKEVPKLEELQYGYQEYLKRKIKKSIAGLDNLSKID